ncbi:MAG: hypothetical protein ICV83_02720 [Cytophagales bacterium]|nr:hypothetical protein [Cytophagales bacterium]
MQTVHNPREKYSNLIFVGVNVLFLIAIFWMLPALGGDYNHPSASAVGPGRRAATTHLHVQPKPATLFNVFAQYLKQNLVQQAH